jgi:hypothetical protein
LVPVGALMVVWACTAPQKATVEVRQAMSGMRTAASIDRIADIPVNLVSLKKRAASKAARSSINSKSYLT